MTESKFGFAVFSYLHWRRITAMQSYFHNYYISRSVCKPSLPVLFTDVCVGAVGRENNWVIVPIENYDSIHNGAGRIQELLQDDLNIEAL